MAPPTLYRWINNGTIAVVDGNKIDRDDADRRLAARPENYRGGQTGGSRSKAAQIVDRADGLTAPVVPPIPKDLTVGTVAHSIAVKEHYLGLLRQLDYDEKAGFVVQIDEVVHRMAGELAVLRNLILGMPAKLAPRVIACRTPSEAEAVIRTECELVLRTISD